MQSIRYLGASLRSSSRKTTTLLFEAPPIFLCPAVRGFVSSSVKLVHPSPCGRSPLRPSQVLRLEAPHTPAVPESDHQAPVTEAETPSDPATRAVELGLPIQCTGCGAFTQFLDPDRAGYFTPDRTDVKKSLGLVPPPSAPRERTEDEVVEDVSKKVDMERLRAMGIDVDSLFARSDRYEPPPPKTPTCDRCHNLVHHSNAEPIAHPSIDALRETIEETPYKYNHVYHVLDAADFPMSMLPRVRELLDMMPLRSRNRRARHGRYFEDRKIEMSFIITRSDLLAPKKEMVDRMMPTLIETLRDALGRSGRNVRLGNVRCVSSKRNWWTKQLKEEIWQRGGAGWMVGKVNVGKSQLFEAVFPKGRMESGGGTKEAATPIEVKLPPRQADADGSISLIEQAKAELAGRPTLEADELEGEAEDTLDEFALLPPLRPETNYPDMPVVSSLPGTTASPIRVPYGNGRGELIDLPGLERSLLDRHVLPEHRHLLLMKRRMRPEQQVLKPGRSLLLGGFIRLTPRTDDLVFLTYAFTPITAHVTQTTKAISIQGQTGEVNVENISMPGTSETIKLAGSFPLKWDVTKHRAGPITRRDAVNLKVERLPYRILSTDILIEGCGWVEIVAQVRTRNLYKPPPPPPPPQPKTVVDSNGIIQSLDLSDDPVEHQDSNNSREAESNEPNWPIIDVYSPEGKFIDARRPFNAWLLNKVPEPKKGRPHKSMIGDKKRKKAAARALKEAQSGGGSAGF